MEGKTGLRAKALRGGAYLSVRQGLGMLISFGGMLLLIRAIGPRAYGLYAAALGIYTYLFSLSQWGVGVYLIRREGELTPEDYHQAFSLLLLLGTSTTALALLALPLLANWVHLDGFKPVAAAIFVALPLNLLSLPPLVHLERALDYRKVALVELGSQIAYYLLALPLAFRGFGAWAAVIGWWAQQLLIVGLLHKISNYRPRWYWEPARLWNMTSYGLGFSASIWIWQLRLLVNPLIVGHYAGAEAVGFIALAIRLVEHLSFIKGVIWRLSIATFGKLQNERDRLLRAINEGMQLQILALGSLLLLFALVGPWLLPALFGTKWVSVMEIFPFIALSYLVNTLFALHSSALYVLQCNWEVALFHLCHIILFAGGVWLLLPRLGFLGYGWGEVMAIPSYLIIHLLTTKYIGKPAYLLAGAWTLALAVALFWQLLGMLAFAMLLGVLVWPATWRALMNYWKLMGGLQYGQPNSEHHH